MCHLNCTALIFLQTTLSRCEKSWHAVNKHILTLFHYVPSIKQATLRMCPYKTHSTFVGKPSKIWRHSCSIPFRCNSHTIHVWYIHLHLPLKTSIHVGKYTIFPWILWDSILKSWLLYTIFSQENDLQFLPLARPFLNEGS